MINSALYDLGDNGGYKVMIEIINPSSQGGVNGEGGGEKASLLALREGESLPESVRNVAESVERTVYAGHVQVRFFSEKLARKNIGSIMDYLLRDTLTDENAFFVVIRDEDPGQIYKGIRGMSDAVGDYILSLSEAQPGTLSEAVFVKTIDFTKDCYTEGKQPVAGVAELVEYEAEAYVKKDSVKDKSKDSQNSEGSKEKEYRIAYRGLAAFKDEKLAGYFDGDEARAYNFITDNIGSAVITTGEEDSQSVFIVQNSKAKITTETDNDQITVNTAIKISLNMVQQNGAFDINKSEELKKIEDAVNKQISEEIAGAIKKAQTDFRSDIFGFGVSMHKQHPEKWEEIKENWDDFFSGAEINVSVESTIDRMGELKHPFRREVGA